MNVYILLDRSGSMATLWDEAIGSINGYVSKLTNSTRVHLAVFDNISHDVVRECKAKDWVKVVPSEMPPRGGTPLYDSCGTIMTAAEKEDAKRTVLVVMTDGYENASKEYTKEAIQAKVKSFENKGWEVIFLGANFDAVDSVSSSLGLGQSKSLNYGVGNFSRGMDILASSTSTYAATGMAINFSDEHKSSVK